MTIKKAEIKWEGDMVFLYINDIKYIGDIKEMMNRIRLQIVKSI